MHDITDQTLIRRVVERDDRHAFATLVRRYQSDLRNSLSQMCRGDKAMAEDLSQEAFIKVYRYLPAFKGESSFKTWLYRIAWNSFFNEKKKKNLWLIDNTAVVNENHMVVEGETERLHLQHDLSSAMAQLSDAQRLMVDMNLLRGFSHQDIVAITGLSLGTVKSHILRARKKLQASLTQSEIVDPCEEKVK